MSGQTPEQAAAHAFVTGCVTRGLTASQASVPPEGQLSTVRGLWADVAQAVVDAATEGSLRACGYTLADVGRFLEAEAAQPPQPAPEPKRPWLHTGCGGRVYFDHSGGYCAGCEAENLDESDYAQQPPLELGPDGTEPPMLTLYRAALERLADEDTPVLATGLGGGAQEELHVRASFAAHTLGRDTCGCTECLVSLGLDGDQ